MKKYNKLIDIIPVNVWTIFIIAVFGIPGIISINLLYFFI
ncbi:MAG: hypothetical protein K6G37_00565 [Bacilli bacterium]|nr:hypothetical protein [Bacilli bacterium]